MYQLVGLEVGDAVVVCVECGGVVGEECDDEVVDVVLEVVDESGNSVGIEGFE